MADGLGFRSLQSIVSERLRDSVLRGDVAPGERLNINEIAAEYGVSPVPVREALRALEAEGLVEFSPNRGALVKQFSGQEVREAFLIRIPLEQVAVREAVPNLSRNDMAQLEKLVDRMDRAADAANWLQLNQEFHLSLYAKARLPRLQQIVVPLWVAVRPYLNLFVQRVTDRTDDQREHRAILDACRRGDAVNAAKLTAEHLAKTRDAILAAFANSMAQASARAGSKRASEKRLPSRRGERTAVRGKPR